MKERYNGKFETRCEGCGAPLLFAYRELPRQHLFEGDGSLVGMHYRGGDYHVGACFRRAVEAGTVRFIDRIVPFGIGDYGSRER